MSSPTADTVTTPLQVYLVWNPKRPDPKGPKPESPNLAFCKSFAERLYAELCRDTMEPLTRGIGIPTFFRSEDAPDSNQPLGIEFGKSKCVCVILLLDYEDVQDDRWVKYVSALREQSKTAPGVNLILPIALDTQALKFPAVAGLNQIRHYEPAKNNLLITVNRILHELNRLLASGIGSGCAPTPVKLFLSHSKADGAKEAIQLKKRIESATPAKPFFDAIDIAAGYDFSDEIIEGIKDSVLVAIVSDTYSSRPWCRLEILTAKKFERPFILVSALKNGDLRQFPYLGNAPVVKWTADIDVIIHAALSEAVRFQFAKQQLEALKAAGRFPEQAKVMARPPELIDLQKHISTGADGEENQVVYPDPPLGQEELNALSEFCTKTQFLTGVMPADAKGLDGRVIGISVANTGELATRGLGESHLRDAAMEIARHLLARGATIAYGGDLRPNGITLNLLDLVFTYAGSGGKSRIRNYRAWSVHWFENEVEKRKLASISDRSTFIELGLPADVAQEFPDCIRSRPSKDDPVGRYVGARSMSFMRETMERDLRGTIAFGGKIREYSGKYPGLFEEVYLALSKGDTAVYVLGGFGGCARHLADLLVGKPPTALTQPFQEEANPGYADFVKLYNGHATTRPELGLEPIDYDRITNSIRDRGIDGLNNGLSASENRRLFDSVDLDEINHLLLKGLSAIADVG